MARSPLLALTRLVVLVENLVNVMCFVGSVVR